MERKEMEKEFEENLPEIKRLVVSYSETSDVVSLRFWTDGRLTSEIKQKGNFDGLMEKDRIEIELPRYSMYDFCEYDPSLNWDDADYFTCAISSTELEERIKLDFREEILSSN